MLRSRVLTYVVVAVFYLSSISFAENFDWEADNISGVGASSVIGDFTLGSSDKPIHDLITKGPWVDVRAFMDGQSGRNTQAVWEADNTVDVTLALQAAVNTGGAVFIPRGTFTYSTTLTLGTSTFLYGAGNKSILKYTGTDNAIYVTRSTETGDLDVITLWNFRLEAPNSTTGILLDVVWGVTINKLDIWGAHTGFTDAIIVIRGSPTANSANINIEHSAIMGAAGHGIRFDQASPSHGAANVNITGNKIEQNYGHGIICSDLTSVGTNITGNVVENNDDGEITIFYGYGAIILGNTLLHVTATGYALDLGDIVGGTGRFRGGVVFGNNITSEGGTSYVVGLNTFEFSAYLGNREVGGTTSEMNVNGQQGSQISYSDTYILNDVRVSNLIVNDDGLHTVIDLRAGVRLRSWTAANIASSTNAVNTTSKAEGKMIWDTTNNIIKVAIGPNATDNWVNTDGTNPVTPTP